MVFTIQSKKEVNMDKLLKYSIGPIILAPVIYLFIIWNSLPEKIAMHFKQDGTAYRFGNKIELLIGIFIFFAISIGIYFLVRNTYKIDRKKYVVGNKDRLHRMAFASSMFISIISSMIIHKSSGGSIRFDVRFIFGAIGFMWCVFGNYMYTMKPNSFAGIRNRWTLNNQENWRKTHLFAGKLWFIAGLLLAAICLLSPQNIAVIAFVIVSISIWLMPIIYSYYIHKTKRDRYEQIL
jgi:uncharacterized membrane protein